MGLAPEAMTGIGPSLRFHLPHPALRGCISSYYVLKTGDRPVDDRLHPEWGNVRFALSGSWTASLENTTGPEAATTDASLFGPTGRSLRITGTAGGEILGIGLLPMGWARLVQLPASRFANRFVPLSELLGRHVGRLLEALRRDTGEAARVARLDRLLLALLARSPEPDPHLAPIQKMLLAGEIETVAGFAAALGLSERTLQRLTPRLFGFAPKPLLRRQRFLRALDRAVHNPGRPFTELLEAGYADQPHFVREFRAFMGLSPSAYFTEPRTMMRLAAAERERVVGQTLQGLHKAPG